MEVLSAIVSGFVTRLAEAAIAPVGRQVGYVIQYHNNLHNLRTKLRSIKDRRRHVLDVNKVTKEVDELTGEVDTFLADEGHAKTKCFHGFCPNPILYYQLSKKAKKLVQKIEPYEKVDFPPQEIFSVPSQDYLAFKSRTRVVTDIVEELRNPNTNKIGVWGVGGVGKSTLAKEVYRQANEEKLFDGVVIIVDVKNYPGSEKCTERIQKEIAEKLDIEFREGLTESGRARHLWDKLKERKILVILDDVWERIEMEVVGIPPTCNLLFTSRSRGRLFSEMDIQKDFCLDTLGEEESWSLFEKMAGGVVKNEPIREKAMLVSKKCEGLPILVVTVARALSNSNTLQEWKDALRRLKKLDMTSSEEKALMTLEWSYDQLDAEELKSLFLLCAILTSLQWHNSIYLEDRFKYSMGLGLLKNIDTMEEARDAFHSLIKKLQNYCLLLENTGGSKKYVRIHELLRNVAIRIARRDKHALISVDGEEFNTWPNKEFFRKCSMICIHQSKLPKFPEVHWVLDFRYDSAALPGNLFEYMKKLQVLDLSALHIPSLPPSLQFLTNLQTLCLDRCVLEDIALVGQLRNMEILSLAGSKIKQLPEEIGQLTRLRLLDLTGCSELVLIPPDVLSSLKSLEDLKMGRDSFRQWEAEGNVGSKRANASLSELKQLSKLTALDIHIPDASILPSGLFLHLERYHVFIGEGWEWLPFDDSFNTLKLKLARSNQLDSGLEMLVKRSEHLYLDVIEGVNDIFHLLNSDDCNQQLKHLHVQDNAEITYVISHNVFQSLQSLTLQNLPKLDGFCSKDARAVVTRMDEKIKINEIILENEMRSPVQLFKNGENLIPNLTNLIVRQCDGLRFLLSYSMARSLVKLKHLEVHNCQIMEEIVSLEEYVEENTDNIFCKLTHLQLLHLPQLTRFCIGSYIEFPSLEILHVEDCTKLETFVLDPVLIQNEETHSSKCHQNPTPYFLFDEKVGFPSLTGVFIYDLPKLITIWHNQLSQDSFCRLSKVDVGRCQSLKNIFPVSVAKGLKQLRILYVQRCNGVETIVAKEEGQEMELNFVFPKATSVTFYMLPQIKCFYNGRHTSKWPLLNYLSVNACPNVALFVSEISRVRKANASTEPFFIIEKNSFPNLDHLVLGGTKLEIWDGPLPADLFAKVKILNVASQRFKSSPDSLQKFHSLESLIVVDTPLEEIFVNHGSRSGTIHAVGTQLPRLRSLKLSRLSMLLHLGVENSQPVVLPNLEVLEVEHCVRLQNLRSSAISFQNLITLKVTGCHGLQYLVTKLMAQSLLHLTHLEVKDCQRLMEIVGGNEDDAGNDIAFTRLQHLELFALPSLRRFCCGNYLVKLPTLETLVVTDCLVKLRISPDQVLLNEFYPERFLQNFNNLENLVLHGDHKEIFFHEENSTGELRTVVTLPHLKSLKFSEMHMLVHLGKEISSQPIIPNLEVLEVSLCEKLQNLSSPAVSFQNLTTLKVFGCHGLEYLITSSIALTLVQLTHLEVKNCERLMEIVGSSREDMAGNEIIAFNKLQHLELSGLPSLQCFFSGNCISHTTICKEIEERECTETVVPCFLFNGKVGFPSLERLMIHDLPKLTTIWHEQFVPHSFCKLKRIFVQGCHSLIKIFGATILERMNALETLLLKQCKLLQLVFELGGITAQETDGTSFTPSKLPEFSQNLVSVEIESCDSLSYIFPASVAKRLPQLRRLWVENCERVEEIVAMEGADMTTPVFVFPNAISVRLLVLPRLASFYPGAHASVWPLLEYLTVMHCGNVEIFALEFSKFQDTPELCLQVKPTKQPFFLIQEDSFYNLKLLELVSWVGRMKNWWSILPAELFSKLKTLGSDCGVIQSGFLQKLPLLEELRLYGSEKEIFIEQGISSGEIQAVETLFPQLKSLYLNMLELMDLGKENSPPVIPNLKILEMQLCGKLKSLRSSAISFQNLQTLMVERCHGLEYLITCSMAQSLTQLTSLEVKDCQKLVEIVANSNQEDDDAVNEIAFMKLRSLQFSNLPCLQGFCSGNCTIKLPSLGTLTVTDCLIELEISSDKVLLSISKPETLYLIEEEATASTCSENSRDYSASESDEEAFSERIKLVEVQASDD